jgi:hypothetical protein
VSLSVSLVRDQCVCVRGVIISVNCICQCMCMLA